MTPILSYDLSSIPLAGGWEDFKISILDVFCNTLEKASVWKELIGKTRENNILKSMKWNLLES